MGRNRSKKSKFLRPLKQLQHGPSRTNTDVEKQAERAQQQMLEGDFPSCISSCDLLLNSLPRDSERYVEVLVMKGLAHGMLKEYHQSYAVFSEAIRLNPMRAEVWYNHGLACHYTSRPAEAIRDFERACALSKNENSELARRMATQLEFARKALQEALDAYENGITLEQFTEMEQLFTQALSLMRQEQWREAELLFRHLAAVEDCVPSYWSNMGVSLMMQKRYDQAEEAFKHALALDPDYAIARNNLKKLPHLRRSQGPITTRILNPSLEEDDRQSLALYEKGDEGEIIDRIVIEKVGHAVMGTSTQRGKQPPRYHFFLNTGKPRRFPTCPRCESTTRPREFTLVVNVNPGRCVVLEKTCPFCRNCDLLMVYRDELERQLATTLRERDPEAIGSDYLIRGTLDKAELKPSSYAQVLEVLHDFQEVVTFGEE